MWIAAAGSESGASALVVELCRHGRVTGVSSRLVLLEAERNIRSKLKPPSLLRFYQILGALELELAEECTDEEVELQSKTIHPKDAHVLAAALKAESAVLLTLDRKHFFTRALANAGLPVRIMTPGDYLRGLVV